MAKDNLKWWILLTVLVGTFLGRLDQTIVSLALPKIMGDFSINVSQAGWIATAYILANAVFVPVWGKLGDTIGRKKVYILGFSIFIFGSILAGLSWNLSSMLVFRIVQAIASSADYPTAMAIIAVTFQGGRERAQALGIWSSSFAAAAVFGPLIGGPLIDNFGWRSVFLINLPVGLIGLIMAIIFVSESKSAKKTVKFDWYGALTLGAMLSALVLVLDQGPAWGWLSTNSLISYFAVIFFAVIFYRIDKYHPEPIVDFKFFRNSIFLGTLINNFIVFMAMMTGVFLVPIFVQIFLGYGATQTGYLFMPMAFGMVIAASIGATFVGRVKGNIIIFVSTLIAALGMLLFTFIDVRSSAWGIIIPLSVMAMGMGLGMSQRTSAIASAVPEHEIGIASSILALARNIAGAFGIALASTVLNNSIESNLVKISQNSVVNVVTPANMKAAATLMILKAQIDAYHVVFTVSAAILLLGAIVAFFVKIDSTTGKDIIIES